MRTEKLPPISEKTFLKMVLALAKLHKWASAHFRPARTAKGWRTAVMGDGKGWPDLVMVRGKRLIFAELKTDSRLSAEQDAWLSRLEQTGAEVYLWTPKNWPQIEDILS